MVSAILMVTEQPALSYHWPLSTPLSSPQSSKTRFRMTTPFSHKKLRLTALSAGNDIAALMPQYITIKRGFFICAGTSKVLL